MALALREMATDLGEEHSREEFSMQLKSPPIVSWWELRSGTSDINLPINWWSSQFGAYTLQSFRL